MRTELAERHETGECRPAADGAAIPLLVPAHVIGVRKADAVAISDGRRYYTLNDFSGRVWELIRDRAASMEEIVDGLAGDYDVGRQRLELDATTAVRSLTDAGLVVPGLKAPPKRLVARAPLSRVRAHDVRLPSVLTCAVTLAWVKLSLRARGWTGTVARIRSRVERRSTELEPSLGVVCAVERRVALAAAFYPGRARCLEQSLALYLLLRSRHVAVRYCQGVQFYPFEAHAWIEYHGQVVNDVAEHVKHFARFPDQLP